jgi:hypothetical protein
MKKNILLTILLFSTCGFLFPQPVLMSEMHSLQAGLDNPMIYSEYADPGVGGADMIWDFRQLRNKQSFTGYLNPSGTSKIGTTFTAANTELIEFDSRFYFNVSSDQIEEYGYSSNDGKSQTLYTTPFIKMKFPFRYNDSYSGSFYGNSLYNGIKTGSISGEYSVEADAYGALILPGDRYIDNTLRVRSEKSYTNDFGSSTQEVDVVTYRWYDLSHRYPLLVLTEYSVTTGSKTTVHHQAAYNNTVVLGLTPMLTEGVSLYPNPTSGELILKLDAVTSDNIFFDIYEATGAKVRSFQFIASQAGPMQLDLTSEIAGLKPAGYLLIIKNGDSMLRKNFTLIE